MGSGGIVVALFRFAKLAEGDARILQALEMALENTRLIARVAEEKKEGKAVSFLKSGVVGAAVMSCLWLLESEEIDIDLIN
jgi:hypothetical protein